MFVINIASPVYEQVEAWQVYSRVTFTENMKNKPKPFPSREQLSQSLMSHLPWTDAADGEPRGLPCTGASQPPAGSGSRERIGFAIARTLPQTDSAIWALGKCSCGWHFVSPPVPAAVGFRWSTEHQGCVGGLWLQQDPNQSTSPPRAGSVWLSASPPLPDAPPWLLAVKSRHSGAAQEIAEVQGQYWQPDFSSAVSKHWQWHQLFAAQLEPHSAESSDSPGDKGSPHRTAASRARKHSWDQIHHSNSRN